MIYREIGKTGLRASIIGFGGMRFFHKDEETALATVRRAVECGITFFETGSYGGGKSETLLGKALKGFVPREKIVLSNKAGAGAWASADALRASLEKSLERERTDYFDFFNFWGVNTPEHLDRVLAPGGALAGAEKARDDGLVRHVGITTHARPEWVLDFCERHPWEIVILKEHMLYSRMQDVITKLGEKGIGVVAMTPLAGGVVAQPSEEIGAELGRAGITAAQLGLRYLVANPHMTSVISGMASPEEVEENVAAGETGEPLTEAERRLVELVRERTTGLTAGDGKFCTSCGYCRPCPNDVNVPGIFHLWNLMRGWGSADYSKLEYQKMRERRHWADFPGADAEACAECGECEEMCPEKLPIIADLKRAHLALTENRPR